MGNMSYCRMENTYIDLVDVENNIDSVSSKSEHKYRKKLIQLCHEIAASYEPDEFDKELDQFEN